MGQSLEAEDKCNRQCPQRSDNGQKPCSSLGSLPCSALNFLSLFHSSFITGISNPQTRVLRKLLNSSTWERGKQGVLMFSQYCEWRSLCLGIPGCISCSLSANLLYSAVAFFSFPILQAKKILWTIQRHLLSLNKQTNKLENLVPNNGLNEIPDPLRMLEQPQNRSRIGDGQPLAPSNGNIPVKRTSILFSKMLG